MTLDLDDLYIRSVEKYGVPPKIGHGVPLFHHDLDDGAHWLDGRKLGGSDSSKLMNVHAYGGTRLQIYREQVGEQPPFEGNYSTERGAFMEEFGRIQFRKHRMGVVEVPWSWRHPRHTFATCNIDGLCEDGGHAEVKCWGDYAKDDLDRFESGDPVDPTSAVGNAWIQCQHNMECLGIGHTWLIVPLQREVRFVRFEYDAAFCALLMEAERSLWEDHIIPCVEPEPVGADVHLVRAAWRLKHLGERQLQMPDLRLASLIKQYDALNEAKAEPKEIVAKLDADLKEVRVLLERRASLYEAKKLVFTIDGRKRMVTLTENKHGTRSTRIT